MDLEEEETKEPRVFSNFELKEQSVNADIIYPSLFSFLSFLSDVLSSRRKDEGARLTRRLGFKKIGK